MQSTPGTPWNQQVATAFIAALIAPPASSDDVPTPIDESPTPLADRARTEQSETVLTALDKVAS